MKTRKWTLVVALALAVTATIAAAALAAAGFKTSRPAQLVALEPGVRIEPILSVGDVVGGYQMSGIPDGLGAYVHGRKTISVVMNHELTGAAPAGVSARISKVELDRKTLGVLDAEYLFKGDEGFLRFCASTLEEINGTPWYFTGEESTAEGSLTSNPGDGFGRGGSSIVLNAETGEWIEARHFGLLPYENNVPVKRLAKAFVLVGEDGDPPPGNESQLYAYIAPTWKQAITGFGGSLYV